MFEFLKKKTEASKARANAPVPASDDNGLTKKLPPKPGKMSVAVTAQTPVSKAPESAQVNTAKPETPKNEVNPTPVNAGGGLKIDPVKNETNNTEAPVKAAAPSQNAPATMQEGKAPNEVKTEAKKEEPKKVDAPKETKIDAKSEEKDTNIFTDLFPKKETAKTDDTLLSSLNASTKNESILKNNKDDSELLIYKKPKLGSTLLKVVVLCGILSSAFLYSQLSPTFTALGQNPVQERQAAYERVVSLQSKVSKQNYVLAKLALDDYLYTADSYLHKAKLLEENLLSQRERSRVEAEFPTLRSQMREDLMFASEKLLEKPLPEGLPANFNEGKNHSQEFKAALKTEIRNDISAAAKADNVDEVAFLRSVSQLTDNEAIKPKLNTLNITTMTDSDFEEVTDILAATDSSGFAALSSIRNSRLKWSNIIEEIERVTKSIDPLFANQFIQSKVGEIFYSSYNLDQRNNSISVLGETYSDDGKNFSVSADLIDAFENSDMFENAIMDSFTKAKENDNSYKGVISIDLTLTKNEN